MKAVLLSIVLVLMASYASADQSPKTCKGDSRVRCVAYDPYEVVTVKAMFGYQTFILFGAGEKVIDLGGGDTAAWDIGFTTAKDGIFIKPKDYKPATNITVITTRRHYNFDFEVEEFKEAEKRTYMVWFAYPEDEARAAAAKNAKVPSVEETLKYASATKTKNEDYWAEGSGEFNPTAAWDDGYFTYLRFAPNTPFPAAYLVNDDGTETLLNKHVPEPNTLALQVTGKKFVLRRGEVFTCIFNESYDSYGVENQSRTVSPEVVRSLRKESDAKEPSDGASQARPPAALHVGSTAPLVPAAPLQREPLPTIDLSRESQKRDPQAGMR